VISIDSIQLTNAAHYQDKDSAPDSVKVEAAHAEGRWYGEGSLGVPFTEKLTQTERNLLSELLQSVAARVAKQKEQEDAAAPVV
jgi:hypothetical protein